MAGLERVGPIHRQAGARAKRRQAARIAPRNARWFVYPEAGTYRGDVKLSSANELAARFVAPSTRNIRNKVQD
jgi:hypothetical protein